MTLPALVFVLNFSELRFFWFFASDCLKVLIHKWKQHLSTIFVRWIWWKEYISYKLFFFLYPSILQVQHSVIHINPLDTIWNTNSHKTTCTITTCIAFTMMLSFRHHQSGTQKIFFPFPFRYICSQLLTWITWNDGKRQKYSVGVKANLQKTFSS